MSRIVFGLRPVEELIRSGREVAALFVDEEERSPALRALAESAARRKISVEKQTKVALSALAEGGLHQGAVAVVAGDYPYAEIDELLGVATARGEDPLLVVLDSVQDPQNLGALLRSAHVLGAHGVVIPQDRAAKVTPSVVKASAGASEHIRVALCTNLVRTLEDLKSRGLWVVGAVADEGIAPSEIDLSGATALVLGAEGKGLRPLVVRSCDHRARIPMVGQVASLNVSAAGAILLYESLRQRNARALVVGGAKGQAGSEGAGGAGEGG